MANVDSILFKQKILQTFKFTKKILERHNLKYIACGGTVLGAVRHQGFIPWDDDIDIYMPREDYNKFIQLNSESEKEGYQIVSVEHSYGYYLPFAKVIDNNTTIWELKEIPYLIGVYVDIFPLDEFPYSDTEITDIQNKATKLFNSYLFTLCNYNFKYLDSSSNCVYFIKVYLIKIGNSIYSITADFPVSNIDIFNPILNNIINSISV